MEERKGREELLPAMRDGIAFRFFVPIYPLLLSIARETNGWKEGGYVLLNLIGFIEFLEEEEFFLLRAV